MSGTLLPVRERGFTRASEVSAAFGVALGIVIAWGVTGPIFNYSDTWQLVINTGTTIVTFLMVFLIQNTQNRDSAAIQLKLDEMIRATQGAHNAPLDLEKLSAKDLEEIRALYETLAERPDTTKKKLGRHGHAGGHSRITHPGDSTKPMIFLRRA